MAQSTKPVPKVEFTGPPHARECDCRICRDGLASMMTANEACEAAVLEVLAESDTEASEG